MDGGGDHTGAAGIAHVITIVAGVITAGFQFFITMWTHTGDDIIQIVIGMIIPGIIARFRIHSFNQIGKDGKITDIGKNNVNGMFRVIRLNHKNRDRK